MEGFILFDERGAPARMGRRLVPRDRKIRLLRLAALRST